MNRENVIELIAKIESLPPSNSYIDNLRFRILDMALSQKTWLDRR